MKKNLLITGISPSKTKGINIPNFHTRRSSHKKFKIKSLQEMQKDLIFNLSKNPDLILKDKKYKKTKDFKSYIKQLDNSISKYQLTYFFSKDESNIEDEKGPNEKFMNIKDKALIKKMYDFNKTIFNKGLASVNKEYNTKINIEQKEYPNPYQSLGIIKHNYHIYNEMSKDFLFRQTGLFNEQIKTVKKHQNLIFAKMPKIHISEPNSNKENFDIPVVDMIEEKDKEKKDEEKLLPLIPHTGTLRLFSYYRYPNRNFPEGKEQFSIFLREKEKQIIICGGLSAFMRGMSIWALDLEKLEWNKISHDSQSNNRFGHTSIIFQNKIYLFGGRTKYGNSFVSPGLEIFSLNDKSFISHDPEGGIIPEPRKNHIAELVGNQMLIHGGIRENNQVLGDCYYLNLSLSQLKWGVCPNVSSTPSPRLYGHTSALVLPKEYYISNKLNIFNYPEVEFANSRIKEKGIYIFGGKSKEEGGLSNKMWIIILGNKKLKWISPDIKGKPPSPRYFHSMSYYDKGNILIIHGGRNDAVSENAALNDTFVFDLENFEWMEVHLYFQLSRFKVLNRCAHQSIIFSNKLIILGGMNNNNYIGSVLFIVNLDFNFAHNNQSEKALIKELENKDDLESKKKLSKIKLDLKKNQLGLVTNVALPEIK